jgi:hypothetical protein
LPSAVYRQTKETFLDNLILLILKATEGSWQTSWLLSLFAHCLVLLIVIASIYKILEKAVSVVVQDQVFGNTLKHWQTELAKRKNKLWLPLGLRKVRYLIWIHFSIRGPTELSRKTLAGSNQKSIFGPLGWVASFVREAWQHTGKISVAISFIYSMAISAIAVIVLPIDIGMHFHSEAVLIWALLLMMWPFSTSKGQLKSIFESDFSLLVVCWGLPTFLFFGENSQTIPVNTAAICLINFLLAKKISSMHNFQNGKLDTSVAPPVADKDLKSEDAKNVTVIKPASRGSDNGTFIFIIAQLLISNTLWSFLTFKFDSEKTLIGYNSISDSVFKGWGPFYAMLSFGMTYLILNVLVKFVGAISKLQDDGQNAKNLHCHRSYSGFLLISSQQCLSSLVYLG